MNFVRCLDVVLTIRESNGQLEESTRPNCVLFTRNSALPVFDIEYTLFGALGLGVEPERMVSSPLLPIEISVKSGDYAICTNLTSPLVTGSGKAP
jgi:hypothetical protein